MVCKDCNEVLKYDISTGFYQCKYCLQVYFGEV